MLRQRVELKVHPSGLPGSDWSVAGWLSVPAGSYSGHLLILVHGAFCTHSYWDLPYEPENYSCVQWCYEQGIATLNIDRLGHGESSMPPGDLLTAGVHAEVLHQIIGQAKGAGIADRTFGACVNVGHSFGSLSSALMQATYGSADALVFTGISGINVSDINDEPETNDAFLKLMLPVRDDPLFAEIVDRYDEHYFSSPLDRRIRMFFRVPPTDPGLIAVDARVRGTITTGETASIGLAANSASLVTCPVLVQMGQFDRLFYDPRSEPDTSATYAAAAAKAPANFTFADLVPDTGHNLAQHPNAHTTYATMGAWLAEVLTD